ncbi:MAG: rod shape-determining protein MreD [Bacteroidota bacterium]
MNSTVLANTLRFLGLVFLQVLVLKRFSLGWENFNYFNIFLYPLFIMLLPLRIPHSLLVGLGFVLGIGIDIFYDSPGVHASAGVFTAFIRPFVLSFMEPRGGYNVNHTPTKARFGLSWFLIYSSVLMFAHLFFYFSVEAFTFYYIGDIFLRTVSSFFISMIFIIMYQFIFDPRD